MKITKLAILALAAVFCTNGLALAKHDNTHTRVSAVVVPSCDSFVAGDLSFGRIDVLNSVNNLSRNAPLRWRCTDGTKVKLTADSDNCNTNQNNWYHNFSMCDRTTTSGHHTLDYWLGYSQNLPDQHCYDYQSPENANILYPNDHNPVSLGTADGTVQHDHICATLDPRSSDTSNPYWQTYAGNAPQHYSDRVTLTLNY